MFNINTVDHIVIIKHWYVYFSPCKILINYSYTVIILLQFLINRIHYDMVLLITMIIVTLIIIPPTFVALIRGVFITNYLITYSNSVTLIRVT